MVEVNVLALLLFAVIPALIIAAYFLERRPEVKRSKSPFPVTVKLETNADKLFHSKVIDDALFDGESTDYAEAVQRFRQTGGA